MAPTCPMGVPLGGTWPLLGQPFCSLIVCLQLHPSDQAPPAKFSPLSTPRNHLVGLKLSESEDPLGKQKYSVEYMNGMH